MYRARDFSGRQLIAVHVVPVMNVTPRLRKAWRMPNRDMRPKCEATFFRRLETAHELDGGVEAVVHVDAVPVAVPVLFRFEVEAVERPASLEGEGDLGGQA